MQERADRGETVYEHRGIKTTVGVLAGPVILGGLAFLAVFKATGGRLPAAYKKALRGQ